MLEFNAEKHEYRWYGARVPSISDFIAPYQDFSKVPEQKLKDKIAFGNSVHDYTAVYDRGLMDLNMVQPFVGEDGSDIYTAIHGWVAVCKEENYKFLYIDQIPGLYSKKYRYAGRPDRITAIDTPEIKSSLPRKATGVQMALQVQLAMENGFIKEPPKKLKSWHVSLGGIWKPAIYDYAECWNVARCLITSLNFFKE
jgi:hypothetical protein